MFLVLAEGTARRPGERAGRSRGAPAGMPRPDTWVHTQEIAVLRSHHLNRSFFGHYLSTWRLYLFDLYEFPVIDKKCFTAEASRAAPTSRLAIWIPLRRAWTTITSVALGAVQFLARSRNMSGGPYGGGSSLATVRAPALRARATRPPSRNIIAHWRAQSCSPRLDRRGRTLGVARHTLARASSRPIESPGRRVRRAKSFSTPLACFPRHPDSDSPASPDSLSSRQFMRVGAVVVGLGYGAVMGTFTSLVRSRVAPFASLPPRAPSARRHREIVRRESSPQGSK